MISKSSEKWLYIQDTDIKHTVIPKGADVNTMCTFDIKYLSIITGLIKRKYVQITNIVWEYLEWNYNISWMKLITKFTCKSHCDPYVQLKEFNWNGINYLTNQIPHRPSLSLKLALPESPGSCEGLEMGTCEGPRETRFV